MKIEWVSPVNDRDIIGNSLGYGLANKNLRAAVGKIIEVDRRADVAVHFSNPQFYFRLPNRKNILFTMCEHNYLTPDYKYVFERCDAVIAPSQFCVDVFKKHTDKPIFLCPLGVDSSIFTAKKRTLKRGQKFRWLYCGAPNLRKFSIMEDVWKFFLKDYASNIELYIKTTGADIPESMGQVISRNGWIVDNRKLPIKELVKLYHSSNAMLFLHMGEGYGLGALEAMSTQMPLVVSDHTGTKDFCNENNSYPVKVDKGEIEVLLGMGGVVETKIIDAGVPNIINTMTRMSELMSNPQQAADKARQAAKDARKLSWDNSAKILKEILEKLA
jgi:glycosyltransferase involved in cell wall biosynthesis